MADGKITLEIVTPQGAVLREEVDEVTAPSVSGEFGVLPGHLPLLAALRTGLVTYRRGAEETKIAVAEGFVEVANDRVLILTDKVITRDEIDPVLVRLELKQVDEQLDHYTGEPGSPEWQALVAREVWAATELELYGDPPPPMLRPFETYGPPALVEDNAVSPAGDDGAQAPSAAPGGQPH